MAINKRLCNVTGSSCWYLTYDREGAQMIASLRGCVRVEKRLCNVTGESCWHLSCDRDGAQMIASLRGRCAFGTGLVIDLYCMYVQKQKAGEQQRKRRDQAHQKSQIAATTGFSLERQQRYDDTRNRASDRFVGYSQLSGR